MSPIDKQSCKLIFKLDNSSYILIRFDYLDRSSQNSLSCLYYARKPIFPSLIYSLILRFFKQLWVLYEGSSLTLVQCAF